MKLKALLSHHKTAILKRWVEVVMETYPADTARFLKNQNNRFTNPVGHTISSGMEQLFEGLLNEEEPDNSSLFLDNIIRIRAVQDFTPSQAVSFIFDLKKVIRRELEKEMVQNSISEEVLALETRIDALVLLSFDIFMKCREKIYDLKANELRNMTFRLLERVNEIGQVPEQELDNRESSIDTIKRNEVTE